MQPDSVLEDVILACLLHGDYACVNSSWATSIAPELDPFPFSGDIAIKIAFKNVAGAIEVISTFYNY